MNVYVEYDAYRKASGGPVEPFMRRCLQTAGYPEAEIDSLVEAMVSTVDTATENLREMMESPTPESTLRNRLKDSLDDLSATISADEELAEGERQSLLAGFFKWLMGSAWHDTKKMTEVLTKGEASDAPMAEPQDWDELDPMRADLPKDDAEKLDADAAVREVGNYLAEASYNRDVLALGCMTEEIRRSVEAEDGPAGEVAQIVVDGLTSNLLSSEEGELKKIAALDYFLRLTADAASKSGLQLMAVKAAHDAFVQVNDLKAAFKRLQLEAKKEIEKARKGADHV